MQQPLERKGYINLPQGFAARWIEGTTPAQGIFTEGVTRCHIFLIQGKTADGKNCFSLIHADTTFTAEMFAKEVAWAGGDKAEITHIKHKNEDYIHHTEEILKTYIDKSIQMPFPEDQRALTVTIKADEKPNIIFSNNEKPDFKAPPLINHPKAVQAAGAHRFQAMLAELHINHIEKDDGKTPYAERISKQYPHKTYLLHNGQNFQFLDSSLSKQASRVKQNADIIKKPSHLVSDVYIHFLPVAEKFYQEQRTEPVYKCTSGLTEAYCSMINRPDLLAQNEGTSNAHNTAVRLAPQKAPSQESTWSLSNAAHSLMSMFSSSEENTEDVSKQQDTQQKPQSGKRDGGYKS